MVTRIMGGAAAALVLGVCFFATAGPIAAEPTKVIKIRGKNLVVYEEATSTSAKRITAPSLGEPLDIIGPPSNGRFKVVIDGKEWWILKAQAVTNEKISVESVGPPVNCQSITTSYASSRGFADCEKKK